MREIKFRAWHIEQKRFIDINGVSTWFGTHPQKGSVYGVTEQGVLREYDLMEIELMQFTGRKDRNGVDIFEGDIVERKYWHNNPPSKRPKIKFVVAKLPVVFDRGKFDLDDSEIRSTEYGTTFNNWWGDGCEVIGDIYQNPELLTTPTRG